MITLKRVSIAEKEILWNLLQKYLYEMTHYYDMDMDASGDYKYKFFDHYFEEDQRLPLFIYHANTLIGFVLLNNYSCLGDSVDYAVGEFTIFPKYRKQHFGGDAVKKIFKEYPGKWEIKYSNANIPAANFWIKAAQKYKPLISPFDENESVLSFIINL